MSNRMVLTLAWLWTSAAIIFSLVAAAVSSVRAIAGIATAIAVVFWIIHYRRRRAHHPKETTPSAPAQQPTTLLPLRRGTGAVVAVGEQYYAKTLRQVWKRAADHDHITIALVPEPTNSHDPQAVRMDILIDGASYKAGYIPRPENSGYARVLRQLTERGITGIGEGKIRLDQSGQYQVYARLSEDPNALIPPILDDPIGEFVDGTFDMVVTGEEGHQDAIKAHARRRYPIAFALHPAQIEKGTHKGKTTFAVYLDGNVIGHLTRAMAEKHWHVLDPIIQAGRRPYLAGRIETDRRGLQVILDGPNTRPEP